MNEKIYYVYALKNVETLVYGMLFCAYDDEDALQHISNGLFDDWQYEHYEIMCIGKFDCNTGMISSEKEYIIPKE